MQARRFANGIHNQPARTLSGDTWDQWTIVCAVVLDSASLTLAGTGIEPRNDAASTRLFAAPTS
jgi:hypothetical protein